MLIHTRTTIFKNSDSSIDFHWFNGSSNLHSHSYYELFVIIDGEFTHSYLGKTIELSKGDVVLITPKYEHFLRSKSKRDLHANFSITEQAFKHITKSYDIDIYDYLKQKSGEPLRLSSEQLSFLINALNSIYAMDDTKSVDYFYTSIIHMLLGFFIVEKENQPLKKNVPDWLIEFLNKLSSPDVFCLPLSEIYKMSNYSQSHFINLFKYYLGTLPITYIQNLKINYAKKLIAHTNYSLLFIANELGFSSYSYFTTFFKNATGISPSEYREEAYIPLKKYVSKNNISNDT